MTRHLRIYSGRNRPELEPVYDLYRRLNGVEVTVEKVYHRDVGRRIIDEAADHRADLLLTNSQLAMEKLRGSDVFDPYPAPVAAAYEAWLRADDFSWLSFTAWPRVLMVNRNVLSNDADWPRSLEDLTDARFAGSAACASLAEMTTVAQFASLRVAEGDAYTESLLQRLVDNGLRVYRSNRDTRDALASENMAVAMANSSNVHVFSMAGNPVAEIWPDQGADQTGTVIEAHTVAVLDDAANKDEARAFIDFLLSVEVQELLARLYGETPVNPDAATGWVRRLRDIQRIDAPVSQVLPLLDSTEQLLAEFGFEKGKDD